MTSGREVYFGSQFCQEQSIMAVKVSLEVVAPQCWEHVTAASHIMAD